MSLIVFPAAAWPFGVTPKKLPRMVALSAPRMSSPVPLFEITFCEPAFGSADDGAVGVGSMKIPAPRLPPALVSSFTPIQLPVIGHELGAVDDVDAGLPSGERQPVDGDVVGVVDGRGHRRLVEGAATSTHGPDRTPITQLWLPLRVTGEVIAGRAEPRAIVSGSSPLKWPSKPITSVRPAEAFDSSIADRSVQSLRGCCARTTWRVAVAVDVSDRSTAEAIGASTPSTPSADRRTNR